MRLVVVDGKQWVFGLRAGVDNEGKACRIRVLWWFFGGGDVWDGTIQDYDVSKRI